jgi:hypothetical protein
MPLFTLPNLSTHAVESITPEVIADLPNPRPLGQTKEQFRSWCVAPTTKSNFLSVWQGVNPKSRIASNNPATLLHGIIGDYDSANAHSHLKDLPTSCGVLPNWVASTFTPGKVRLLWEFETPVCVSNPELTERFMRELDKRIRFSKALPGYDKASVGENQYFEMGQDWRKVTDVTPVSTNLLEMAMIEAGAHAKLSTADVEIPIEAIAEEVHRQFPARWSKPFEVGQRGPLFWLDDGIDREGCVINANGMVCFSDRAASNFMPWRSILGSKFVQEYEQEVIGGAAQTFYYDGRNYWRKTQGCWQSIAREDVRVQLKDMGVSDQKRKNQPASDLERVLVHIQLNRRVAAAAPILYRDGDVEEVEGVKYLNTNNRQAMQPAPEGQGDPEKFPWIWKFMEQGFDDGHDLHGDAPRARDYFLGWFHHFYASALNRDLQPGQVLVIAGDAHAGKSFINRWLIGAALGGSINATQVLMKQSSFNKGAGEVGLWRVDDAPTDGDYRDKRRFTQALKEHAANPTLLYQPKFKDAVELPFLGRVCITMNLDPESLALLPAMDSSFADKIMMFKIRKGFSPKFHRTTTENESMILKELPFFLRWVLDWGASHIPEEIMNKAKPRYGVKPYHHPELVEESHVETMEYGLKEVLESWCVEKSKDKNAQGVYTASELLQELRSSALGDTIRNMTPVMVGRNLKKLHGVYPKLHKIRVLKGITRYTFNFWEDAEFIDVVEIENGSSVNSESVPF